jgi:hypothetical protein
MRSHVIKFGKRKKQLACDGTLSPTVAGNTIKASCANTAVTVVNEVGTATTAANSCVTAAHPVAAAENEVGMATTAANSYVTAAHPVAAAVNEVGTETRSARQPRSR